jgi:hypothetical protein
VEKGSHHPAAKVLQIGRHRPTGPGPARGRAGDRRHTNVHAHAYKIDNDTLFSLQAALGYGIGQTLFVAPNVLLVEGTSDLIYLQLLSRACEQAGKAGLDRRWTITPVGGIDRMDTFVRLFKGQQLNICALIDASSNKPSKVEKLVRDGISRPSS